jgi:putative restriction endonuclease
MNDLQKIKINGVEYNIIDSMQDFRAEDSFIHWKNKLSRFKGNGESKKHVGTYKGEIGEKISLFFNYDNWGIPHKDPIKKRKTINSAIESKAVISFNRCFFSKSNLRSYLNNAKTEYRIQEQDYRDDISEYYEDRVHEVENLNTEQIYFSIYDASDNIDQKQNRAYIRSEEKIWDFWRQLILPGISYISILKLISVDHPNEEPYFYFRVLLDYQFRTYKHPSLTKSLLILEEKEEQLNQDTRKARKGSVKFKRDVHDHMPQCPFTYIKDERLLIASHIKPHAICIKEGKTNEDIDKLNGLSLSPTYDKLFDQGYITFTNDGELICASLLSSYTWGKLDINPNTRKKMRIYPEGREKYLEYHRNNVFQDEIDFI